MQHPKSTAISREEFVHTLGNSGLFSADELKKALSFAPEDADAPSLARQLSAAGKLTDFQVEALLERKAEGLVLGNYEVLARLGAGGMGTVYKARHRRMKRVVAIKVLSRSIADNAMFVRRFQREVETIAQLTHPNIVMAFDADEAEAGPFLVMEFVNGRDLASRVLEGGPMSLRDAVDAILQAARGLAYAHSQNIVHRDVKPANLLQDESGVVKVADLGLARLNDSLNQPSDKPGSLTQAGSVVGTVDFMAPEQAEDSTTIDLRADVYSLGCTLYFLLTGTPPYVGHNLMATLCKHSTATIPSLCKPRPDAPPALDSLVQSMLAKRPTDRCASMEEVVRTLEALLPTLPSTPAPTQPPTSTAVALGLGDATVLVGSFDQLAGLVGPAPAAPPPETLIGVVRQPDPPSTQIPVLAVLNVLLVEPSRTQATIVRKFLQDVGVENILTVSSGQKAIEALKGTRPQVVLSTMHLNDMTGVQLAQKVRSEPGLQSINFILISSEADPTANPLHGTPRTAVLSKPFTLEQLKRALQQAAR